MPPQSGCLSFIYATAGDTVEFREASTAYGPGGRPCGQGYSTLHMNGKLLFNSSDIVDHGHGAHVWTRQTQELQWTAWQDPVIVRSAKQLAPPSPPYTPWRDSALGRVAVALQPLEQVNFTEYDSELLIYSREISRSELAAAVAPAATAAAAAAAVIDATAVPLTLLSGVGNAYTVFLNGQKAAVGWESGHHGGTVLLGHDDVSRFNCPFLRQQANGSEVPAEECPGNITLDLSAHLLASEQPGGPPLLLSLLSTSLGVTNGGGINNTASRNSSSGVKGIVAAAVRPPAIPGKVSLRESQRESFSSVHAWRPASLILVTKRVLVQLADGS